MPSNQMEDGFRPSAYQIGHCVARVAAAAIKRHSSLSMRAGKADLLRRAIQSADEQVAANSVLILGYNERRLIIGGPIQTDHWEKIARVRDLRKAPPKLEPFGKDFVVQDMVRQFLAGDQPGLSEQNKYTVLDVEKQFLLGEVDFDQVRLAWGEVLLPNEYPHNPLENKPKKTPSKESKKPRED